MRHPLIKQPGVVQPSRHKGARSGASVVQRWKTRDEAGGFPGGVTGEVCRAS
jgi:hypothetical protein